MEEEDEQEGALDRVSRLDGESGFETPEEVVAAAEEKVGLDEVVEAEVRRLKISSKAEAGPGGAEGVGRSGKGRDGGAVGNDSGVVGNDGDAVGRERGAVGGKEKEAIACMVRMCEASRAARFGEGKLRSR